MNTKNRSPSGKHGRGPSLQDVARAAGVSPSTVSLVLNERSNVAESTRRAVLEVVKKINYVPLVSGRPRGAGLNENRSNRIAVVVAGKTRTMLKSPVYTEVLHGVETALAAKDKSMLIRFVCHDEVSDLPFVPTKTDGVLLLGEMDEARFRREFRNVPLVHFMGDHPYDRVYDHVTYDDQTVGILAAEHLLAGGHRHAAVVTGFGGSNLWNRSHTFTQRFEAGGGQVLKLSSSTPLLIADEERNEADWRAMRRLAEPLLLAAPRPTAAFLPVDMLLPLFYDSIRELGIEPGRDMDVVGCNNERPYLDGLRPRPATIDIHACDVGARAVEQLLWRMDNPNASQNIIRITPTLVI